MPIDSHCHLSYKELGSYTLMSKNIVKTAQDNNIKYIVDVATKIADFEKSLNFSQTTEGVFSGIGVHPCNVSLAEHENFTEENLLKYINNNKLNNKLIAIGETGLDYYHSLAYKTKQIDYFKLHCEVAVLHDLPIIIHTRNAYADTISILKEYKDRNLKGVIHCFSGDVSEVKQALDLEFFISFSGILTFKNAKELHEVCKYVPFSQILIETDAPYLAPHPFRGKTNLPEYVGLVATAVAKLKNITEKEANGQIINNFLKLFNKVSLEG